MPLLFLVHEPARYLAKEWYLEPVKHVCVLVCLEGQEGYQADVAEEEEPAKERRP